MAVGRTAKVSPMTWPPTVTRCRTSPPRPHRCPLLCMILTASALGPASALAGDANYSLGHESVRQEHAAGHGGYGKSQLAINVKLINIVKNT
jgi:hypothetical protein